MQITGQDVLTIIEQVVSPLGAVPYTESIFLKPHNFFHGKNTNIYTCLLRQALQDWLKEDTKCIREYLIPALGLVARLLIMDTIVPQKGRIALS